MKRYFLLLLLSHMCVAVSGQEYNGTTGLLHVPSAEMDTVGTFRGGLAFLHKKFTPDQLMTNPEKKKYNTYSYYFSITAMPWLEVSYACALLYMHKNGNSKEPIGYYNEDRRVNVKLRPLKEGRWWPAIAVGMDDIGRFNRIDDGRNGNNYFQNFYIAGAKHLNLSNNELGFHLAYRYYTSKKNSNQRGVAGGLTLRPAFYRPLRVVAEWDGRGVNAGADVLLWRHLFMQAALVHGQGLNAAIGYHYTIPF
jgi:hypothetical protein